MDDPARKPQRWLIVTAVVVAVLMTFYYTGSWVMVVLLFSTLGICAAYQMTRARKPASHACLRCGATLNPNARQCSSCGSASWTTRDG